MPHHPQTPTLTTLLLLNLPPSTFLGLDLFSFTTSPTPHKHIFHGLKLIPPGFHHLYTSPGPYSDFTPRTGIWFSASGRPGSVVALQWDDDSQCMVGLKEQKVLGGTRPEWFKWWYEGSLVEYRARGGAGVENISDTKLWRGMMGEITEATLRRILPTAEENGLGEDGGRGWRVESAMSTIGDRGDDILKDIKTPGQRRDARGVGEGEGDQEGDGEGKEQVLGLLPIDLKRTWPVNAMGRERTIMATDRSWYLNRMVEEHILPIPLPAPASTFTTAPTINTPTTSPTITSPLDPGLRDILAELQFTFLHALTISNFSSAEGYKRLLTLCLTCERLILIHPQLYHQLLTILTTQLGYGLDCFESIGSSGEGEGDAEKGGFVPDWLADPSTPLPRLLRGFLRTLKRLLGDVTAEENANEPASTPHDHESRKQNLEALLADFAHLEEVVSTKFDWVADASKIVKRGMVQLEDGELVELELTGLLEEEEEEEGDGPVVVEL